MKIPRSLLIYRELFHNLEVWTCLTQFPKSNKVETFSNQVQLSTTKLMKFIIPIYLLLIEFVYLRNFDFPPNFLIVLMRSSIFTKYPNLRKYRTNKCIFRKLFLIQRSYACQSNNLYGVRHRSRFYPTSYHIVSEFRPQNLRKNIESRGQK